MQNGAFKAAAPLPSSALWPQQGSLPWAECGPQRHAQPGPQNGAIFGMRVLAGGIQDLQVSVLDWGPKSYDCVLLHRGDTVMGVLGAA